MKPKFIANIDWEQLREQKQTLIGLVESNMIPLLNDNLNGLISLIDNVQDYAVDEMDIDELLVFNFKKKTKLVCSVCGGDNIAVRTWTNPNKNFTPTDILKFVEDEDDIWCNDCDASCRLKMENS